MILDDRLIVDVNFLVAGAAALALGNGAVDLGLKPLDVTQYPRHDMPMDEWAMEWTVTEAFTVGAGTPVVALGIGCSNDTTLTVNTYALGVSGGALVGANVGFLASALTLGRRIRVGMSPPQAVLLGNETFSLQVPKFLPRFIFSFYLQPVAGASFALGRMSSRLVHRSPSDWKAYQDGLPTP